jgi:hypothetical protein
MLVEEDKAQKKFFIGDSIFNNGAGMYHIFGASIIGLISGVVIGLITEYFTGTDTRPVNAIVKPASKLAYAGKGVQKAGDHCKWCKVKAQCATLGSQAIKMAKEDFKKEFKANPHLLTDEQIMKVFSSMKLITEYVKAVSEYVYKEAQGGKKWTGHKLVAGRSNRIWTNEDMVKQMLDEELFSEEQYMSSPKLLGITAVEKLVGKENFDSIVGEYVTKPQGKPTLVKDSDKRPELGSESAEADFGKTEEKDL